MRSIKKTGLIFYRDSKKEHRWKTVAKNGKITAASSEGFKRISGARNNLRVTINVLTGN